MDFLEKILDYKRGVIERKRHFYDQLKEKLGQTDFTRYGVFKRMISRPEQVNLIAEIKKASLSKGLIREDFNIFQIAQAYTDNGCAALSVLTEDKYFLGKPEYIKQLSDKVDVPILTKDFIFDEGQIYEAKVNGAGAILLITAMLSDGQLRSLMATAVSLDLDCLIEVHDREELERAIDLDAEIIGINHRNLRTFEVDTKVSEALISHIPKDKVIVAESGIKSHDDIQRLQIAGVHAVLIGEIFMRADNIGDKVKEVMG